MSRPTSSVRAYGILEREGRVLLVRSSSPLIDPPLWWLPGGGVAFGESPVEAVAREFAEETGLTVSDPVLLDVVADVRRRPNGDRIHTVRVIYRIDGAEGQLRDEAEGTTDRAEWFDVDALDGLNLAEFTRLALTQALGK